MPRQLITRWRERYCALAGHKWKMTSDWLYGAQTCKRCGAMMGARNASLNREQIEKELG